MQLLYLYLLIINATGLLIMLVDKENAKEKLWRIPEKTILTVAAIGGSFGSLLGMYIFRHKTRHRKFNIGLPVMFSIHIMIAVLVYSFMQK